jgi:plastocyanin
MLLALVASTMLATIAFGGTASATHGGPGGHRIEINRFGYYPNILEVHMGDAIDVRNIDGDRHGVPHSVTSIKGYFDTGLMFGGTTETIYAPENKGRYKYYCIEHPFMVGYIKVVGVFA